MKNYFTFKAVCFLASDFLNTVCILLRVLEILLENNTKQDARVLYLRIHGSYAARVIQVFPIITVTLTTVIMASVIYCTAIKFWWQPFANFDYEKIYFTFFFFFCLSSLLAPTIMRHKSFWHQVCEQRLIVPLYWSEIRAW